MSFHGSDRMKGVPAWSGAPKSGEHQNLSTVEGILKMINTQHQNYRGALKIRDASHALQILEQPSLPIGISFEAKTDLLHHAKKIRAEARQALVVQTTEEIVVTASSSTPTEKATPVIEVKTPEIKPETEKVVVPANDPVADPNEPETSSTDENEQMVIEEDQPVATAREAVDSELPEKILQLRAEIDKEVPAKVKGQTRHISADTWNKLIELHRLLAGLNFNLQKYLFGRYEMHFTTFYSKRKKILEAAKISNANVEEVIPAPDSSVIEEANTETETGDVIEPEVIVFPTVKDPQPVALVHPAAVEPVPDTPITSLTLAELCQRVSEKAGKILKMVQS